MVIGAVLMGFTYLITDTMLQYIIGTLLTAALFLFR